MLTLLTVNGLVHSVGLHVKFTVRGVRCQTSTDDLTELMSASVSQLMMMMMMCSGDH